jgi:hypothetical protein
VLPGSTAAVLTTAPTPVITPHASNDAAFGSIALSMATTCEACTTTCSANAAVRSPCTIVSPSCVVSGERWSSAKVVVHATNSPRLQRRQSPHDRINVTTTDCPTWNATPGPTSATTPAASCP